MYVSRCATIYLHIHTSSKSPSGFLFLKVLLLFLRYFLKVLLRYERVALDPSSSVGGGGAIMLFRLCGMLLYCTVDPATMWMLILKRLLLAMLVGCNVRPMVRIGEYLCFATFCQISVSARRGDAAIVVPFRPCCQAHSTHVSPGYELEMMAILWR